MRTTPFHARTGPANRTHLWTHWAGYLAAEKYDPSPTYEYFSIRNGVGLFDTSPLFKYRITGPEAESFLAGVLARDIRTCAVGSCQYTIWCDDDGYVLEDGIIMRAAESEYWLTAAEPNLAYFSKLAGGMDVTIDDVSDAFALLAVQGPNAAKVLSAAGFPVADLAYFRTANVSWGDTDVTVARTGFTGDLGYELWIPSDQAVAVWDAITEAGVGYRTVPFGMTALGMARLEAGMLLIDVDFRSARHAWTDAQRETPDELGLGSLIKLNRPFVGARSIANERQSGSTRWQTVGITLDATTYERIYNQAGHIAPKAEQYFEEPHSLYDADYNETPDANYVGYATSLMFSPILKRHIGIAKLPLDRIAPGSECFIEMTVDYRPYYFPAFVTPRPFLNPARKTAKEPT